MDEGLDITDLPRAIEAGDTERIRELCARYGLEIRDGRVVARDPAAARAAAHHWDLRQLVDKVRMNSVYGALLNEAFRFHDRRLGSAVTLSGRAVLGEIAADVDRILCGGEGDAEGPAVVYGDTDSCYFSAACAGDSLASPWRVPENVDEAVALADVVAGRLNTDLPDLVSKAFGVAGERSKIEVKREVVATSGLFARKKRYALLVADSEGERHDPPLLKVVGFEVRRTDTPEEVQEFLARVLTMILGNRTVDEIRAEIRAFRDGLREGETWTIARLQTVRALPDIAGDLPRLVSAKGIPAHVRGAIAWNILSRAHPEEPVPEVSAGTKVRVCHLLPNPLRLTVVAIPTEVEMPPSWFRDLPFDVDRMVDDMLRARLEGIVPENVLKALGTDLGMQEDLF